MNIQKQLNEVTEQDLLALIAAEVREGKTIEYKERVSVSEEAQKRKFVALISSFANASGGDIIFGIKQDHTGVPRQLIALPSFNPDRDILTLRDLARAHIDPPLFGVEFREVPIQGGMALIVRIPKAWDGAHMVTYGGDNRFYTRDAGGHVLMNVPEIRSSFTTLELLGERIRRFRFERLSRVRSQELPVSLIDGAKAIFHVFPLQSFEPGFQRDLTSLLKRNEVHPMALIRGGTFHDIDGFYVADVAIPQESRGYTAVLRNGCIEAVQRIGREHWIPNPGFEQTLITFFPECVNWLGILELRAPAVVMLSILDSQGCILVFSPACSYPRQPVKHRDLIFHEIFLPTFTKPAEEILRPFCDAIWHACGLMRSFNFDESGKWTPKTWEFVHNL